MYDVQYEEGKGFSLRNIGTGKYLGANTLSADEDEPTYFAFVQLTDDYISTVQELLAEGEAMKANVTDQAAKAAYDAAIAGIDPATITGDGLAEAQTVDAALDVLVKYQNAAGADMTRAIINPSFESGTLDGWTSTDGGKVENSGWFGYKTGCYYFDKSDNYQGLHKNENPLLQTITDMPNGMYKLTAEMRNTEANTTFHKKYEGFYLVANDNKTAVQADGETVEVTTIVADGTITIGTELFNCTGRWVCADNFRLTFVRPTTNKERLANDITVAQTIVDDRKNVGEDFFMISPKAPEKLQQTIDAAKDVNDNEDATQAEVDAAIAALAAAKEEYNSAASMNLPDPEKQYVLYLTNANNIVHYMNLADGVTIQEEGTPLSFVVEDDQYYLTAEGGLSVGLGDGNRLSTDADKRIALSFTALGNNEYHIQTSYGLVGTNQASLNFGTYCTADRGAGDVNTMWTIEECTTANMSVKAGKWGTFVAPFGVTIPEGIKAYTVTGTMTDAEVTYTETEEVTTTIPANTPVILLNKTEENLEKTFTGGVRQPENETVTEGLLTGIYQAGIDIPAESYVLQTPKGGEQGFYYVNETITEQGVANRCYLAMPAGNAPLRAIFFGSEEGTTGIEAAEATGAEDGILYNLSGQRLTLPTRASSSRRARQC